jgi:hypothetical protein
MKMVAMHLVTACFLKYTPTWQMPFRYLAPYEQWPSFLWELPLLWWFLAAVPLGIMLAFALKKAHRKGGIVSLSLKAGTGGEARELALPRRLL